MKPRRWHVLQGNSDTSRPSDHVFLDIESRLHKINDHDTEHRLWFGWACYWRRRPDKAGDTLEWFRFTKAGDLWAFVLGKVRPKNPLYLVSHNTAYDFGILDIFKHLEGAEFDLTSVYLGNLSVIMRFRRGKEKIVLLDNANYFQGKLANLGDAIGIPKGDVNPLTATEAECDPYCKQDVNIMLKLWQFYYDFLEKHNLGNWGPTLPSQAFHAYRHRFMPHKIVIHGNSEALAMERESYHGGRTSVFFQGVKTGEPFHKLDVNSMYPYIMKEHPFPVRYYAIRTGISLERLREKLNRFDCVARVTLNTDIPVYPVLIANHLIYPVGRFTTTLTTPEVKFALDHNHLEACHRVSLYERAKIFEDYVSEFYRLKVQYTREGNKPFRTLTKLYLNSLYGKFGQLSTNWEEMENPIADLLECTSMRDHETGESWQLYRFGSRLWRMQATGESSNSFPAIAAHVTAYARLYLWELIEKAGRKHVFYCDTDSLIVDSFGLAQLGGYLDDVRLGALKIEEQADTLEIRSPKHYALGNHWKRKGVPSKARYLGDNTWETVNFPSFKSQNKPDNKAPFHTRQVVKHLTDKLYDGVADASGRVTPLEASSIIPHETLKASTLAKIAILENQISAYNDALPLDAQTVFTLWNYRSGTFRKARSSQGALVPLEYSNMDSLADEKGFDDLEAMKEATLTYLEIRRSISTLQAQRQALLYPAPTEDNQAPFPF